jgi:hypothetical protein
LIFYNIYLINDQEFLSLLVVYKLLKVIKIISHFQVSISLLLLYYYSIKFNYLHGVISNIKLFFDIYNMNIRYSEYNTNHQKQWTLDDF